MIPISFPYRDMGILGDGYLRYRAENKEKMRYMLATENTENTESLFYKEEKRKRGKEIGFNKEEKRERDFTWRYKFGFIESR